MTVQKTWGSFGDVTVRLVGCLRSERGRAERDEGAGRGASSAGIGGLVSGFEGAPTASEPSFTFARRPLLSQTLRTS